MVLVKVDKLVPGMVLAEDVRDVNSRLLLAKGQSIGDQHLRVLKMWGVFEVPIAGEDNSEPADPVPFDSERMAAVMQEVRGIFGRVDIEHPAVREIVRLSIEHRLSHSNAVRIPAAPAPESRPKPVSTQEMLVKLDRIEVKLPEVPSLVFELNEIISDPMSSAGDIAQVVNKSPSLAALLLKIVNSAFFGFRSKIDAIPRAVMLIGSKEVSNLALGITIMETFRGISKEVIDVASFLEHSLACGVLSRILAAHANIAHTEQLFVSGMLHDIGRLVLCNHFPQSALLAFDEAGRCGIPLFKAEQAVLGCTHSHLGKKLLTKWKLPYALENAVFYHHQPSASPSPDMAAAVQMADMIVHGLGVGVSGERQVPSFDTQAWERINLPVGAFRSLIRQASHQFETFREVLKRGQGDGGHGRQHC